MKVNNLSETFQAGVHLTMYLRILLRLSPFLARPPYTVVLSAYLPQIQYYLKREQFMNGGLIS